MTKIKQWLWDFLRVVTQRRNTEISPSERIFSIKYLQLDDYSESWDLQKTVVYCYMLVVLLCLIFMCLIPPTKIFYWFILQMFVSIYNRTQTTSGKFNYSVQLFTYWERHSWGGNFSQFSGYKRYEWNIYCVEN